MILEKRKSKVLEYLKLDARERADLYKEALSKIVDNIVSCALLFIAMKEAGDDVDFIPHGLQYYYERIADDKMLPEVINLQGNLRKLVSNLPIKDQEDVISGKRFPLVVIENGKTEVLKVDPRTLQPIQVKQLFFGGYVRKEPEQRSFIESMSLQEPVIKNYAPFIVSKKKRKIIVTKPTEISFKELSKILLENE